jgi:hypothetical protein
VIHANYDLQDETKILLCHVTHRISQTLEKKYMVDSLILKNTTVKRQCSINTTPFSPNQIIYQSIPQCIIIY